MSNLRELAAKVLSRSDGTGGGTQLERMEHATSFQNGALGSVSVEPDFARNSAKKEPCSNVPIPIHGTSGTWPRLSSVPRPLSFDPRWWRLLVSNGEKLMSQGWAVQAIELDWSELDLFGVGFEHHESDGLAAWLEGRKLRALCGSWAVASDANGNRHYFNRPRPAGGVLLWKLGRGR